MTVPTLGVTSTMLMCAACPDFRSFGCSWVHQGGVLVRVRAVHGVAVCQWRPRHRPCQVRTGVLTWHASRSPALPSNAHRRGAECAVVGRPPRVVTQHVPACVPQSPAPLLQVYEPGPRAVGRRRGDGAGPVAPARIHRLLQLATTRRRGCHRRCGCYGSRQGWAHTDRKVPPALAKLGVWASAARGTLRADVTDVLVAAEPLVKDSRYLS